LTHILAVLGAAPAAGRLLAFNGPGSGGSGISPPGSGAVPAPGSSAAQLSGGEQAIVTKVKPGPALINTTPRYDSEAAAGTGMVINADGLVLTNNHVIDDSTKITGTVASTGKAYPATVVGYDKTEDAARLHAEIAAQGYQGSNRSVRRYRQPLRATLTASGAPAAPADRPGSHPVGSPATPTTSPRTRQPSWKRSRPAARS